MASKNVQLPDGRIVAFPDSMSDDAISAVIQKELGPPAKPSAASRFASSAADSSGLSTIGHAIMHPGETLAAINDLPNPNGAIATGVKGVINNTVDNAKKGWADYHKEGLTQNTRRDFGRAVPIVGPALAKAQEQHDTGDDAGMAGTMVGTVAGLAAPEVVKEGLKTVPSVSDAATKWKNRFRPENLSLTPQEEATQSLIRGTTPDIAAVQRIKGATSEIPDALAYAKRVGQPVNGTLDAAKAMRDRAAEIQAHYEDNLLKPHSGKIQGVPPEYEGERFGNGETRNQATLGQINDRVNEINKELKSNFRKARTSQTVEANASDADLNAEKGKLTNILHTKLGDMNGLQPEDIASVRQRAGKLRSLAEETELSADRDTVGEGATKKGGTNLPGSKAGVVERLYQGLQGGREVIGNRMLNKALKGFPAEETPLPEPKPVEDVPPSKREPLWKGIQAEKPPVLSSEPDVDAVTAARNKFQERIEANKTASAARDAEAAAQRQAAQQEVLRSQQTEQAAQDASAARNAEAERLRGQNVSKQQDIAKTEATRAVEGEQSAQDAATARNAEAERLRAENVARQQQSAQGEVVRAVQGEQTAQDLAAARAKFAAGRRGANVAADQASTDAQAAANKTAAQQEVTKAIELQQGAQDASSGRSAVASEARAPKEEQPTIQDKEVVPADASKGVQPVTLPVEVPSASTHPSGKVTGIDQDTGLPIVKRGEAPVPAKEETADAGPTPDTHVFSRQDWAKQNPDGDADEAAAAAKEAGYEVQD